jgi:hypothetical protein
MFWILHIGSPQAIVSPALFSLTHLVFALLNCGVHILARFDYFKEGRVHPADEKFSRTVAQKPQLESAPIDLTRLAVVCASTEAFSRIESAVEGPMLRVIEPCKT